MRMCIIYLPGRGAAAHRPSPIDLLLPTDEQVTHQRLLSAAAANGNGNGDSVLCAAARNGYHSHTPLTSSISRLEFCIVEAPYRVRVVVDADRRGQGLAPSVVVALERRWTDEGVAEMGEHPFKGRRERASIDGCVCL